ncbi:MAG TPA: fatty acid desaturase [Burkholderiales bacterium]|nr:fatty acid desaturase [Burkholderiales bacterium]
MCATGALVLYAHGVWRVPAILVHGYVLIFLFCALHEATHYTPFRSRWLSTALGHFAGFLLLLPFEYFRLFHWDHHRYTQDPARDPELARPKPATPGAYLLHVSGLPNWGVRILTLARHAFTGQVPQPWVPGQARPIVVLEARLYAAAYLAAIGASIALGSTLLIWLWVLPALAGQLFLRPYLLAEHTGCEMSSDTYGNTRTTITNPVVRFFAWNMPYHVEHHAYPAIPFHSLPRAHEHLRGAERTVSPGYLSATRSIFRYLTSHHSPARESAAARTEAKTS